jgi:glycosyltransferase involved in cell wall biosynthesis
MRVLIITYETPAYPGPGGPGRAHSLLEPLAGRHEVRVVSTGGTPAVGRPPAGVDLRLIDPGPRRDPGGWFARNLAHHLRGRAWVREAAAHHHDALAAALPGELAAFRPAVVQVEHGELGGLLNAVPRPAARVLALHNLLHEVQRQRAAAATGTERVTARLEDPLVARLERRDLRAADVALVVTEVDGATARALAPGARVMVVPNCVDTGYFAPQDQESAEPSVVMTASFDYPPNGIAAAHLLGEVLPTLRRRVPGVRLVLAGRGVSAGLLARAHAAGGVEVTGEVADLRPHLWRAWLALAPLTTGSGSPLKVLEALASGTPVVTTQRVATALAVGPGDGVIVADPGAPFAEVIAQLLLDGPRRSALAACALNAAPRFDRRAAAERLEQAWEAAVEQAAAAPRRG